MFFIQYRLHNLMAIFLYTFVSHIVLFPHSWLITWFLTRLTRRVPLLTFPEHLSSHPVVSKVRVTRYLVLYVCFVDRCLSLCAFSFGHCVVCSSSIDGFWLPLWYRQTLLPILLITYNVIDTMSATYLIVTFCTGLYHTCITYNVIDMISYFLPDSNRSVHVCITHI